LKKKKELFGRRGKIFAKVWKRNDAKKRTVWKTAVKRREKKKINSGKFTHRNVERGGTKKY